ncbi:MAG: DUF4231 domain-containing protein [Frankiaceae bacterium]
MATWRRRVPLLARLPKLRAPGRSPAVIPPEKKAGYPELDADFALLATVVEPVFTKYDLGALREQNRYRRQQCLVLLGAAAVTGLGGLQAALPHSRWPELVLAVLGVGLAASSARVKEATAQSDYLDQRVKAERLRALHFQYLSTTGRYAGSGRERALREAVIAIQRGEELG